MKIIPITLKTANEYVTQYHRHHKACTGCKFCIGCKDGEQLVGGLNGQCFLFLLNGIEIIGNIHDNHALLEVENET